MIVALDYDDTYSLDPEFWDQVIDLAQTRGHEIHCVTMRHSTNPVSGPFTDIHYTGFKAKREHMKTKGIKVDVWIDDSPHWILIDAADGSELTLKVGPIPHPPGWVGLVES